MMKNDSGMNSSPLRMKPYLSEKIVPIRRKAKRKPMPGSSESTSKMVGMPKKSSTKTARQALTQNQMRGAQRRATGYKGPRGR